MHGTKYMVEEQFFIGFLGGLFIVIVSVKLSENVLINWWKLGQNPPEEAKSVCG